MKKTISYLLALVFAFALCVPCFADDAGPMFLEYDAYVSNPKGAKTVNVFEDEDFKSMTVPYETKVRVHGETRYKGKLYAFITYNENYCCIDTADIAKKVSKVDKSSAKKLSEPITKVVIAKDGAKIYDGPAESYAVIGTIPYGETVTANYATENGDYAAWAYVTYGSVSGWLYIFEDDSYNCARVLPNSNYTAEIMQDGYYLYELPTCESKKVTSQLPVGTKLSYKYNYTEKDEFVFAEYNGSKGWLPLNYETDSGAFSCAVKIDSGVFVSGKNGTKLYEKVTKNNSSKVLAVIPRGELLNTSKTVSYYDDTNDTYSSWHYVRYNDHSGWVCEEYKDDYDPSCRLLNDFEKGKIIKDTVIYSKPGLNSQKAGTASAGASYEGTYFQDNETGSLMYYVKVNNIVGWIINPDDNTLKSEHYIYDKYMIHFSEIHPEAVNTEKPEEPETEKETTTIPAPEIKSDVQDKTDITDKTDNSDQQDEKGTSPRMIIIACVAGAIILALTGLVIALLVNKRRK